MSDTKKCYECKNIFRKTELVDYASPRAKILHSYCPKCLKEKQSRDNFSDKVCFIFGLKNPGPRIWAERKRLQATYGYSDEILIDCLEYIYKVKNFKKFAESLCLISPSMVDEMMQYKRNKTHEGLKLVQAMQTETTEYIAPVEKSKKKNKVEYNPDDWLDD